ncbi:TorD/DmsD family molecular chaperone [Georgenia faecalis]|uniref:Molecular chaperone n=1 Tax=Georgenia faecalis TaxID=2483799 RepID=A0ABV9DCI2_9MICO|nr:hypothetical protein [Georgenia faecalis]
MSGHRVQDRLRAGQGVPFPTERVLTGRAPARRPTASALVTLARVLADRPDDALLAATCEARETWPVRGDAESRRGLALLGESEIAQESADRVGADYDRLFAGPDALAPLRTRDLRRASDAAEAPVPPEALALLHLPVTGPADHLAVMLATLAALPTAGADDDGDTLLVVRAERVRRDLLTWGPRCFTRAQNGSKTYFYQGVAALGLGLLRDLER